MSQGRLFVWHHELITEGAVPNIYNRVFKRVHSGSLAQFTRTANGAKPHFIKKKMLWKKRSLLGLNADVHVWASVTDLSWDEENDVHL